MVHLARMARQLTGSKNLCVAGGVALNCVANGRLMRETDFQEFFFYPAAGDTGTSVGAALYVEHILHQSARTYEVASEYLGQGFTNNDVRKILERGQLSFRTLTDPERLASRMIADGLVIAWFQGRAEFGPRALGNRSILADPRREDMKDWLNANVKFREGFRPYAPSVLEESCGKYFSFSVPSPYMLRAYDTRKEMLNIIPAITHLDGTFNIQGEPIINTVDEAIKCLMTTGLDALFVEDFLIIKDPVKLAPYLT